MKQKIIDFLSGTWWAGLGVIVAGIGLFLRKQAIRTEVKGHNNLDISGNKNKVVNNQITFIANSLEKEIDNTEYLVQDNKGGKFIVLGNYKYYIANPETRKAMGFNTTSFSPVSEIELNRLISGGVINLKTSLLIRANKSGDKVYAVIDYPKKVKRHIPDPETLEALGRRFDEVEIIGDSEFEKIPTKDRLISKDRWGV